MSIKASIYHLSLCVACLSLVELITVSSVQAQTGTLALCQGQNSTVRIYYENDETKMRVFDQQDQVVWLDTGAQAETTQAGVTYENIMGEQTVSLFIPEAQTSCIITIGDQSPDSGTLISENMTRQTVTGTIAYREKMALPPGSQVTIKLLDTSLQDVAAQEISTQIITTSGEQVPLPFSLSYEPSQILPQNTYTVRAEIYLKDQLAFTTTQSYPVITRDNPTEVDLMLQRVSSQASPSLSEQLKGTKWLLQDLNGRGVMDNLQTTLEFDESNRLGGNGGCNRYFTGYELTESQLSISVIGSTQMMCPEAVMNQEQEYFKALEKARTIRLEGPYLFIDSDGYEQPLRFTRHSQT